MNKEYSLTQSQTDKYSWLLTFFAEFKTHKLGKKPHQYLCYQRSKQNKSLFEFLETTGFFEFHLTNLNRVLVAEHQIVAYFCCGGQEAKANGFFCCKDEQELHHLDGNTFNNHPSNLIYVPSETHAQITKHQRFLHKGLRCFKQGGVESHLIWNRKGKLVKRFQTWFVNLLAKTLLATAHIKKVPLIIKEFGNYLKKVGARLKAGISTTWVSNFFIDWEGWDKLRGFV